MASWVDSCRDRVQQSGSVARRMWVMGEPGLEHGVETLGWPEDLVVTYRRDGERLIRVATLVLGTRAEAEEVVQEAFVASARQWAGVRDPGAYLRRAVVNRCHGLLRRRVTANRWRPDPPPPSAPVQLVELRDVLLSLPYRQRTAIVLRYLEDLSDEEIADVLGCRRATVRSLVAGACPATRGASVIDFETERGIADALREIASWGAPPTSDTDSTVGAVSVTVGGDHRLGRSRWYLGAVAAESL